MGSARSGGDLLVGASVSVAYRSPRFYLAPFALKGRLILPIFPNKILIMLPLRSSVTWQSPMCMADLPASSSRTACEHCLTLNWLTDPSPLGLPFCIEKPLYPDIERDEDDILPMISR